MNNFVKRNLMTLEEFFTIEPPKERIGIPCGRYLCVSCCVEEYMECGADIECNPAIKTKFLMIIGGIAIALLVLISYLLLVKKFNGKKY